MLRISPIQYSCTKFSLEVLKPIRYNENIIKNPKISENDKSIEIHTHPDVDLEFDEMKEMYKIILENPSKVVSVEHSGIFVSYTDKYIPSDYEVFDYNWYSKRRFERVYGLKWCFVHLTNLCTYKCKYCYLYDEIMKIGDENFISETSKFFDHREELIKMLRRCDLPVTYGGGEPTLVPLHYKHHDIATVTTNLHNPKSVMKWCLENSIDGICISMPFIYNVDLWNDVRDDDYYDFMDRFYKFAKIYGILASANRIIFDETMLPDVCISIILTNKVNLEELLFSLKMIGGTWERFTGEKLRLLLLDYIPVKDVNIRPLKREELIKILPDVFAEIYADKNNTLGHYYDVVHIDVCLAKKVGFDWCSFIRKYGLMSKVEYSVSEKKWTKYVERNCLMGFKHCKIS